MADTERAPRVHTRHNLAGRRFGSWLVIERDKDAPPRRPAWICLCDCGLRKRVYQTHLLTGDSRSCGCQRRRDIKALDRGERELAVSPDRFWPKVDKSGGPDACWPWKSAKHYRWGYGKVMVKRAPRQHMLGTHRVAWALTNGPIPRGLYICHHCDNPPCCNPAHLFAGTAADNNRDKIAKGRHSARQVAS